MPNVYPQQTIRHWGTYANAAALPGVAATAVPILKVGDFAFTVANVLYQCTAAGFPATWAAIGVVPAPTTLNAAYQGGNTMSVVDGEGVFTVDGTAITALGEAMLIDMTGVGAGITGLIITAGAGLALVANGGVDIGKAARDSFYRGGVQILVDKSVVTGTGAYTAAVTDHLTQVDTSTGAIGTITLPNTAPTDANCAREFIFEDIGNAAATNPITIAAPGGGTINGGASFIINWNSGRVCIHSKKGSGTVFNAS